VLTVRCEGGVATSIANRLPGMHAAISIAGLRSRNLVKAFDQLPPFDLCLVDLERAALSELEEIFGISRQFLRAGGKLVAFHLNSDGEFLAPEHLLRTGLGGLWDGARVHYAGSAASARVVRDFREALSRYQITGIRGRLGLALSLARLAPRALLANRAEAKTLPEGLSIEPTTWTSITVEVSV